MPVKRGPPPEHIPLQMSSKLLFARQSATGGPRTRTPSGQFPSWALSWFLRPKSVRKS